MGKKVLSWAYIVTVVLSAAAFAAITLVSGFAADTAIGFVIGTVITAVCMVFMSLTIANRSLAGVFYFARVTVMFGSAAVFAFVPGVDGVGVIVPLIIHIPVTAAAAAVFAKKSNKKQNKEKTIETKGEETDV